MKRTSARRPEELPKAPSGIPGLDGITGGGLPRGRPTLVCGSAGCGKTLFAMEFLVHGAMDHGEPGVFLAFEETPEELADNVRSLGFDVDDLVARRLLFIDHVLLEPTEIEEAGEYDLEGLFLRLGSAIDAVGAKRVAIDTLEALFGAFANEAILRAELRRLFRWLKDRGVTAVVTAERGAGTLTRRGLEEYVSDCVILLDHRVSDQVATRRLWIPKYRGTSHGTNEYPFLIDDHGLEVFPITSAGLEHEASDERLSTGVPSLDELFGGGGPYRGSTILVSGTAGTGKTSLAASVVDAACRRGERCLYFAFEESSAQIARNMRSIGIDLDSWQKKGLLEFHAARPTLLGIEAHLTLIYRAAREFEPSLVVLDPITNLSAAGSAVLAENMLVRLIDFFKSAGATLLLTSLTHGGAAAEATDVGISSLTDTWLLLRQIESNGERNRGIYVLKSRGTSHSNQIREFLLTDQGIVLADMHLGPDGMPAGSARAAQNVREKAFEKRTQEIALQHLAPDRRRDALDADIATDSAFEAQPAEAEESIGMAEKREETFETDLDAEARQRGSRLDPSRAVPKRRPGLKMAKPGGRS